ncbi:NAD(P)H-dependent oxidoreductase [Streptomyces sp. NBC_00554]|uniref:NADPH-dependent FMN reductase n=1 Tax=Streptomyces sp. NBC_00554 TaxID=2903661 RepID=UPI00352C3B95|nr:NAD(P)H-dependent oxidoreductase [Streptomyces sp. NBC_00554]
MPAPHLQIIVGSTRPGRRGHAVGTWFHDLAVRHEAFGIEFVDLAEVGLPLLDEPRPPQRGQYDHDHTRRWSETVRAADAYVFVVPEYNHSYNAATKNALDFLAKEWAGKPVAFVAYGGVSGGARAVTALIPVVSALKMVPLSHSVHIPSIRTAMTSGGTFESSPGLDADASAMLDELRRLTVALSALRLGDPVG